MKLAALSLWGLVATAPTSQAELEARLQAANEAKDWVRLEATAAELQTQACATPQSSECAKWRALVQAARLRLADDLLTQGKDAEAATRYLQVADAPQAEHADQALFNAAISMGRAGHPEQALPLYERLYTQYPKSPLAEGALFRAAVGAEESRDFDKAIERYERLVRAYPASRNRASSMANRARLLEGSKRYPEAAQAYAAYAEAYPSELDAPVFLYRAAQTYAQAGDHKAALAVLQAFQRKYKAGSQQGELIVDSHLRTAEAYDALEQPKAARKACEACLAEYRWRGLTERDVVATRAVEACRARLAR